MRRVFRQFFTVVSALSLLLCVAVCVLWVRSYRVSDHVHITTQDRGVYVALGRGAIAVSYTRLVEFPGIGESGFRVPGRGYDAIEPPIDAFEYVRRQYELLDFPPLSPDEKVSWKGFAVCTGMFFVSPLLIVRTPLWAPAGVFLVLPLLAAKFRARVWHRRARGLCRICGYNLRAHHTGERCPECGTAVNPAA